MTTLKDICTQVLEAAEKAGPFPWQRNRTVIHCGKESGHETNSEVVAFAPLHLLDSKKYEKIDYAILAVNNAENLARAVRVCLEELHDIRAQLETHDRRPKLETLNNCLVMADHAITEIEAMK